MPEEIMKIPCAVARDLMSVEENGRYAEETRPILQKHLSECPDCARIRADMERPVAVEPVSEAESERFREKALETERNNPLKTALRAAGLILGAIILILLGVNGYSHLTMCDYDVPMNQYDYELFRTEDGDVYGHLQFKEGVKPTRASMSLSGPDREGVLEIEYKKPIIETEKWSKGRPRGQTNWLCLRFNDGKLCYFTGEDMQEAAEVKEIRLAYANGTGYRVIWREGEEIPMSCETG